VTRAVVFDLAGVLIDWSPRYLYAKLLGSDEEIDDFLTKVCSPSWRAEQDRGRSLAAATAVLQAQFPQHGDLIAAYYGRWEEMLAGEIKGSVSVLTELSTSGVPLYALTNWSRETFDMMRPRFAFLEEFRGVVLSGDEGVLKPDAAIFGALERRYGLSPSTTVFVDDSISNVGAASVLGYDAIHFTAAPALRSALAERGLLPASPDRVRTP
jgi:2-haloacid dehalogenase